eukprot:TRINITY_DN11581_c0_g1_i1.p1 TRINITY_DN11581_c0_g1~~TRINITY_DN11581_c0_g1_i1.p1  ORF type:complete len:505 (-),score=148.76 TRINITY_DN11581_c0_g1_i1:104-1618(-)
MGMGSKKRQKQVVEEEEEPTAVVEEAVEETKPKKRKKALEEEPLEPVEETKPKKKKKEAAAAATEEATTDGSRLSAEEFRKQAKIVAVRNEGATEDPVLPDPVQSFDEAPFSKKIREALGAAFSAPSHIQAQAWPIAAEGSDLVAVAKTGSGKTLAFLCPAFKLISKAVKEGLEPTKGVVRPLALVLAPTRELATQIEVECQKFASYAKVRSAAVFGGAPKNEQGKAMKKADPHVLVATPGRLQDFMNSGEVDLKGVQLLVLDEADRMLDMGFEPEIAKILSSTPKEKQTLLFTATWPKAVKKIASKYLKKEHIHVNVGDTEDLSANKAVSQEFFKLDDDEKENKFHQILDSLPESAKVICFLNTKRRVEQYHKSFIAKGYKNCALHGDKPQWERDRDLAEFANGAAWLMFATDVCARGLDIKAVSHVVNFDMARDVESYVHRIGRTGRAGNKGTSITFFNHAYDTECSPALVKIAKEAGQEVPEFLEKIAAKQTQVKNKAWRY